MPGIVFLHCFHISCECYKLQQISEASPNAVALAVTLVWLLQCSLILEMLLQVVHASISVSTAVYLKMI
jgi:hypothetical protein